MENVIVILWKMEDKKNKTPQTSDMRQNVSQKFTEPSIKTHVVYSVLHQYGGRKILQTSIPVTYFDYLSN